MPLAGIELRYIVNNIKELANDYYVSNIYGINKNSLLFKLHHKEKQDIFLVISTSGIWITSTKITNIESNKLLRRLRSDLIRSKFIKIEQIDIERIACVVFKEKQNEFRLICEFFGGGNIILCNHEMKVTALLHSINVRHRNLITGSKYIAPPKNGLNILEINYDKLKEVTEISTAASKWIGRTYGMPSRYIEFIFRLSNIKLETAGNNLSIDNVNKILKITLEIVNRVIDGKHEPIIVKNNNKLEAYPLRLSESIENITVSSFNDGLDYLFTKEFVNENKNIKTGTVEKEYNELKNKLREQEKAIEIVKTKSKKISNLAKALLCMSYNGVLSINDPRIINTLIEQNAKIINKKGMKFIEIDEKTMKIGEKTSIHSIVSTLYDESKHQLNAIKSIENIKSKTEKIMKKLKNKSLKIKEAIIVTKIRKKRWFERYRWFHTSDGLLAIGGRDASSNSTIVRKHTNSNDKIFHADIFGSPFFILKDGMNASHKSITETSNATVCFSRAWKESVYGVNAYWINHDQIKKAAPSGQFLSKGSFIIDGKRNYIKISTLRLAICLDEVDNKHVVICNPVESVKKNLICYAIIEPTGLEISEIAKIIKNEFLKIKLFTGITLDDFIRVMPPGKSHIIKIIKK